MTPLRSLVGFRSWFTCVVSLALAGPAFAQSAGEYTVDGGTATLASSATFSGDGEAYKIPVSDLAFESTSQRNALVVFGGGTLTLQSGAAVAVANANNLTAFMRVGYGTDGSLVIEDGATLAVGSASRYANFQIGQGTHDGGTPAVGTVTQNGGTATIIGSFNVGVNGGEGVYTVNGGSLIFDNAGATAANRTSLVSIGFNNATSAAGTSAGTLNLKGGLVELTAPHDGGVVEFIVGNRAKDALAAYNGGVVTAAGAGNGVVNQTGGTFRVGAGAALFLSAYGNGEYNLLGGTLEVGGSSLQTQYGNQAGYTYALKLGGGTLKSYGSALVTAADLTLVAGAASTIDTAGLGATLSGNILGAGTHQIDYGGSALVKAGAGTLTLSGSSRILDTFGVTAGTVRQTAGATSAVEFMTGTGSGASGDFVLDGGSLTVGPSTKASDGAVVAGSLRIGDFGGTGTFTQNGGTVTALANTGFNIGNQGGSGTYILNAGTLTLNDGLHVLGRAQSGKPAGQGTLLINGGTLNLQGSAALINGNNQPDGPAGSGTITQTGGVLHIDGSAALYVSGYTPAGPGTYNLNGGTLEVGAGSLNGRYNNSVTTYAFNLGGGTVKVTGSALTTSINATLTAATTSTINTNGLGATWSGALSGEGGLRKTGAGTLTLSGSNAFSGATTVEAGTLAIGGTLSQSSVSVASGATLAGHGTVAELSLLDGGQLELGGAPGALTISGDLSLAGTSRLLLRLGGASSYDHLAVGGTISGAGGVLDVSLQSFSPVSGASFDLFDGNFAPGFTFSSVVLPSLGADLQWNTSQLYATGVISVATATAVPEPATWAVVAGAVALAATGWRRWRRDVPATAGPGR